MLTKHVAKSARDNGLAKWIVLGFRILYSPVAALSFKAYGRTKILGTIYCSLTCLSAAS